VRRLICLFGWLNFVSINGFAAQNVWICVSKCDVTEQRFREVSAGKNTTAVAAKELSTFVFHGVGNSEQEAFSKLTNKCKGQLYIGKNESTEARYVSATVENACDHN
jgi:hypothetical protein